MTWKAQPWHAEQDNPDDDQKDTTGGKGPDDRDGEVETPEK